MLLYVGKGDPHRPSLELSTIDAVHRAEDGTFLAVSMRSLVVRYLRRVTH